jgi:murein DD-endopeptidase MepM/ murein hydrolase activator NlpD
VSLDVAGIVDQARIAAADAQKDGKVTSDEREKLKHVAAEFESMLLVQMFKDMRKSGSWENGDEEKDSLGAETMFDTLDVELASYLARVKGMGLQQEMLGAFDRMQPAGASTAQEMGPGLMAPTTESAPRQLAPVAPAAMAPGSRPTMAAPATSDESTPMLKPISGAVTSEFGWRRDPFTNRMKFHQGVDLRAAYGQDVQAAGAGTVVFSGQQGGYGTSVVIEHQDGTKTRYAHLSATLVAKGDRVDAGAAVGRAGHSGHAIGTHLHFEVIGTDGRRMAPQQWASADTAGRALPGMDGHSGRGSAD